MFDPNSTHPVKDIVDALGVLLWGVTGGLANLFVSGRRPSFYALLSCFFVSGFAGLMASKIVEVSPLPPYLKEFVIGMAGFGGPVTLHILYRKMMKEQLGVTDKDIKDAEEVGDDEYKNQDKS